MGLIDLGSRLLRRTFSHEKYLKELADKIRRMVKRMKNNEPIDYSVLASLSHEGQEDG